MLAVRGREYSETMGQYTGRERKRGAIAELVRVIRGGENRFLAFEGRSGGAAPLPLSAGPGRGHRAAHGHRRPTGGHRPAIRSTVRYGTKSITG